MTSFAIFVLFKKLNFQIENFDFSNSDVKNEKCIRFWDEKDEKVATCHTFKEEFFNAWGFLLNKLQHEGFGMNLNEKLCCNDLVFAKNVAFKKSPLDWFLLCKNYRFCMFRAVSKKMFFNFKDNNGSDFN